MNLLYSLIILLIKLNIFLLFDVFLYYIDIRGVNMSIDTLTLPDKDKLSGIGFLKQTSVAQTYPAHTHDFYEIFLVTKGKAIHIVNGVTQLVIRGSFVFLRPNDVHNYRFFKSFDFEFITIGIPVSEINITIKYLCLEITPFLEPVEAPIILLEGSSLLDMESKMEKIGETEVGIERHMYFRALLPWLIYRFYKNSTEKENKINVPPWFLKLLELMSEQDNYVQGLSKMLVLANYSQEHLTRVFRRYLDITPTEFINEKRMNYAAQLLKSNEYEVLDICLRCGCNNLSHFYHLFKKYYKCSPKEYIKDYS